MRTSQSSPSMMKRNGARYATRPRTFFAKTVTFVQSVKKLRQGFSHPILLSRADNCVVVRDVGA